jgi:hypothetical protein
VRRVGRVLICGHTSAAFTHAENARMLVTAPFRVIVPMVAFTWTFAGAMDRFARTKLGATMYNEPLTIWALLLVVHIVAPIKAKADLIQVPSKYVVNAQMCPMGTIKYISVDLKRIESAAKASQKTVSEWMRGLVATALGA